ncbi:epoxyqueuosine reductase [Carboxydothermus pertinax]|uniref:4Fe-4S ferredoxin-type domain-containing protein n=1 Tax=Carboxydothermus pertinax TaxID=870242 RepID=A0A1L8CX11_9THEO|nr:epoxyqueuosine reductase [Carboxydothermus pertinax]GAV23433.1 hypothetical protein cpu_19430 [Carboxydothermus pertinax]
MKDLIEKIVKNEVLAEEESTFYYRSPLIGYASCQNPLFLKLKEVANPEHLMPQDLLPGAKTAVAIFLPYTREIIESNKEGLYPSELWAKAYVKTNKLLWRIITKIKEELQTLGYNAEGLMPTYQFDKKILKAIWSHKHVAYIAGLGTFGLNNLLITPLGSGGRFASFVTDLELPANKTLTPYLQCDREKGCTYCLDICPVGALKDDNTAFDRQRCYAWCVQCGEVFKDSFPVEICGKCATGPCAYREL